MVDHIVVCANPQMHPSTPGQFHVGAITLTLDPMTLAKLAVDAALDLLAICEEIEPQITSAWPDVTSDRFSHFIEVQPAAFEPLRYAHSRASFLFTLVEADVALGGRKLLAFLGEPYGTAFTAGQDVGGTLVTNALSAYQRIQVEMLRLQREEKGQNWGSASPDPSWDEHNQAFLSSGRQLEANAS